jgi:signal transduction histidine kinase
VVLPVVGGAGCIAHDFNNLLTAIRCFAEFHLDEHTTGDPGREDVTQIERPAERATRLTQDLLAFRAPPVPSRD